MKLIGIPQDKYEHYRLDVIFDGYKWDPQFLDNNTIAKHVLVLSEAEAQALMDDTEALYQETIAAEQYINTHHEHIKKLRLSRKVRSDIRNMSNYNPNQHIRLMRFDFHPTQDGWALSEVNSDVPGGFAESSLMPLIAKSYLPEGDFNNINFGNILVEAIKEKVAPKGRIMMVHCTSYSDDRQVMQFIGDQLSMLGYQVIYGAADHLVFKDQEAYSILDHNEGKIDGIVRFNPLEWVVDIKPKMWGGYFTTTTPSCNHPIAEFTQSKRFPLLWTDLEACGLSFKHWRRLLPETMSSKEANGNPDFIYKPVWGRVGENISIKEACRDDEYEKIIKDVKKHPNRYIAQRKFTSKPLVSEDGTHYHVCIGSYVVNGKAAGFYGRISDKPRIDSHAADIPVLIERDNHDK